MNTYSNHPGATECLPCLDDQYSYEGATECMDRPCMPLAATAHVLPLFFFFLFYCCCSLLLISLSLHTGGLLLPLGPVYEQRTKTGLPNHLSYFVDSALVVDWLTAPA